MTKDQATARARLFSAPAHRETPTALPATKSDFVIPRVPLKPGAALIRFRISRYESERNLLAILVLIDAALVLTLAGFGAWTAASLAALLWFGFAVLLILKIDKLNFWRALQNITGKERSK